jgi:hypothetical protein
VEKAWDELAHALTEWVRFAVFVRRDGHAGRQGWQREVVEGMVLVAPLQLRVPFAGRMVAGMRVVLEGRFVFSIPSQGDPLTHNGYKRQRKTVHARTLSVWASCAIWLSDSL